MKVNRDTLSLISAYLATRANSMRIELQYPYGVPPIVDDYQDYSIRLLREYSTQEVISTRTDMEGAYSHGLLGEDVLIGLSDTGIDVNSCFFYDSKHEVRYDSNAEDTNHRKIALYIPYSNNAEDGGNAHGTHVAGTLAGETEEDSSLSAYNGIAYRSRLVFFDIGTGTGQDTKLETPRRIVNLIDAVYSAGALVHSASWGSYTNSYTYDTACIDNYM